MPIHPFSESEMFQLISDLLKKFLTCNQTDFNVLFICAFVLKTIQKKAHGMEYNVGVTVPNYLDSRTKYGDTETYPTGEGLSGKVCEMDNFEMKLKIREKSMVVSAPSRQLVLTRKGP